MKDKLLAVFNIKHEESSKVLLLITQSIFLGTFFGAFEIGASELFLEAYGSELLPKAILISGITGILFTTIYSRFHSRITFSKLAIINLLFITLITALIRLGYEINDFKWLAFIVFVFMGPLNIIGLLSFWGTVSRMFTLRQGKRLFGLIDTGQVIGIIISSYSIPVLLTFKFKTIDTLLISAVSILLALLFQIIISHKYHSVVATKQEKNTKEKLSLKNEYSILFKDKYIFLMVLFVALSMITAFFIYNSFLAIINEKYPDSTELAKFLGFFTGTLMIFSLLIKTFVYSNLMKTYGLKTSILLAPIMLLMLTVLASIVGSFGYTVDSSTFMFFFLLIVLSRLFSVALKSSIEGPSLKLLYQSLESKIRFEIQAKLDGVVNELSATLAGILLTILAIVEFFKIIHFSYSLSIILFIWIIVTYKLYKEYKKSLERSLAETKDDANKQTSYELDYHIQIKNLSTNNDPNILINTLNLLEYIDPILFQEKLLKLTTSENKILKNYLYQKLSAIEHLELILIIKNNNKTLFELLCSKNENISNYIKDIESKNIKEKINKFARSQDSSERKYAIKLIEISGIENANNDYNKLVHDPDHKVRCEAYKITNIESPQFIPFLIDGLENKYTKGVCSNKLVDFGEKSLDMLEHNFHKTDIYEHIQVEIIRIMGIIGGKKAHHHLLNKLTHNSKVILEQTISALRISNFTSNEKTKARLIQTIDKKIRNIAWIYSALVSINSLQNNNILHEAILQELENNLNSLFSLMSVTYDTDSIQHVKDNMDIGTSESIGFAIELLDLFIDEEIKAKIFPLIEDISFNEKTKQLENHYPIKHLSGLELILAILNKNPNEINRYTKMCALQVYEKMKNSEISNALIAQLFNPDNLLSQTSALICHAKDKEVYKLCSRRIKPRIKLKLDQAIQNAATNYYDLFYYKLIQLKKVDKLQSIPGEFLTNLVEKMNFTKSELFDQSFLKNNLLILTQGNVIVHTNNEQIVIENKSILNNQFNNISEIKISNDDTELYYIEKINILELILNNQTFTQYIYSNDLINSIYN